MGRVFIEALVRPEPEVRLEAVKALRKKVIKTRDSAEALAGALSDEDAQVRMEVARGLVESETHTVPAILGLSRALRDSEQQVRLGAVEALANMTKNDLAARAEVKAAASDALVLPEVRLLAALALAANKDEEELVVATLRAIRNDTVVTEEIRLLASLGLMRMSIHDEPVDKTIEKAVRHPERSIGRAACELCLQTETTISRGLCAVLLAAKYSDYRAVSEDASLAMDAISHYAPNPGPKDRAFLTPTVRRIKDLDPRAQQWLDKVQATQPSGTTPPSTAQAVPPPPDSSTNVDELKARLIHKHATVRIAVAVELARRSENDTAEMMKVITEAVRAHEEGQRGEQGQYQIMGPPAPSRPFWFLPTSNPFAKPVAALGGPAIPHLVAGIKHPSVAVRLLALECLARMRADTTEVIAALNEALKDPNPDVRSSAAYGLGLVGPGAKMAIDGLGELLLDEKAAVRYSAARTLLRLGADSPVTRFAVATIANDRSIEEVVADTTDLDVWKGQFFSRRWMALAAAFPLPPFPWPPPQWSDMALLANNRLGNEKALLKDVHERLDGALKAAAYREPVTFSAPGGFAMVTPLERIPLPGESLPEAHRWTRGKIPMRSWDLLAYLERLFLEAPGQFRIIVFIVTDHAYLDRTEKEWNEEDLIMGLTKGGGQGLDPEIGKLPLAGRKCFALVYHFEKRLREVFRRLDPSPQIVEEHLKRAGLWQRLAVLK
jgi:HEAT repeat protein